jgi:hypothetical protein
MISLDCIPISWQGGVMLALPTGAFWALVAIAFSQAARTGMDTIAFMFL